MPRSNNIAVQNNFNKGLITEATGLTFPENACTDADNCLFNHFGFCSRRLGFDFENNFGSSSQSVDGQVVVTYLWKNVAGEGDTNFVVVQIGDTLHFYEVTSDSPLSANKHATTIDLTDFNPLGSTVSVATIECQFSSGNGLLFVTNRQLTSFYVSYNGTTFTATAINIQIRDFAGEPTDATTLGVRPAANSNAHNYNLLNQGWTATLISQWHTSRPTDYPSNSDVAYVYKATSGVFDFSIVNNFILGNTQAPRGHFIYNLYNINRSANTGGTITDEVITSERVSTSAFMSGRIFFSGLRKNGRDSQIYFSQVVEAGDNASYGKCYQENDPTSEKFFDLLPTDGGVIDLIEAGSIIKLVPLFNTLLVFCSNGVWAVTGSQGQGFQANDYVAQKISSITNVSPTSFVNVEGIPFWWNLEGIYTISQKDTGVAPPQNYEVKSLTDFTIRSYFLDIPAESKLYVRGAYDQFTKRVQWIFKSTPSESFNDRYVYDRILTFNLLSGAFFPWSLDDTNVRLHSIVDVFGFSGVLSQADVTSNSGSNMVKTDGTFTDQVIAFVTTNTSITSIMKYFCSYTDGTNKVTFAENYKDTYKDWESFDDIGQDYDSFFITGYGVHGKGMNRFQQNYINVFSENSVDSSYKFQSIWDYGSVPNSGRWSTSQVFNLLADDFGFKMNRIKVRGQGKACQFKFSNNSNQPFNIVGWAFFETGNQWI